MKAYKLILNQVDSDPNFGISSNYVAPRTQKSTEYYLSKEKAETRCREIYDSTHKLLGFIPKIEVLVREIDIIE